MQWALETGAFKLEQLPQAVLACACLQPLAATTLVCAIIAQARASDCTKRLEGATMRLMQLDTILDARSLWARLLWLLFLTILTTQWARFTPEEQYGRHGLVKGS